MKRRGFIEQCRKERKEKRVWLSGTARTRFWNLSLSRNFLRERFLVKQLFKRLKEVV